MLLSALARPLCGPQVSPRYTAAQRRPASHPGRLLRCAAASEDEAGTAEGRESAVDLPPLKQMPYRAIAGLAAVGLAGTAYLTAVKVLNLTPACPLNLTGSAGVGGGCGDILSSRYSTLFGVVPLAAMGMLAYGGVAAVALAGARFSAAGAAAAAAAWAKHTSPAGEPEEAPEVSAAQVEGEAPFRTGVLAGGLALASCSSFLLRILATEFEGQLCPWCLGSAALSFGIAALAISGLRARELEEAAAPGAGVVATTLLLLSLGLGNPDLSLASAGYDLDYNLPAVSTQSAPGAVSLAQRLRDSGARMYGAFWCSHCYDQKQSFGAEAMEAFPYVECYPEGLHKDTKIAAVCETAPGGLTGFPTWIIGGEQLVGEQSFEQLEAALARAQAATAAAPAPAS